ncbi:hypothetical protein Q1695_016443 [Nippostrongylus brasiliensis]|nr:hypothetical protein Q1695_016443 [Nippostrongylus brasiliensis]
MLDGAARVQSRQFLPPPSSLAPSAAASTTTHPHAVSSSARGAVGRRRASAFVRRVSMAIPTLTADPVPFSTVSEEDFLIKNQNDSMRLTLVELDFIKETAPCAIGQQMSVYSSFVTSTAIRIV